MPGAASQQPALAVVDGTKFKAINPDAFKDGFSVDALLTYLARDVLKSKLGGRTPSSPERATGPVPYAASAPLAKVQALLSTLDRAERELEVLHKEVNRRVGQLQVSMGRQEATYQEGVQAAQDAASRLNDAFKDVEERAQLIGNVGLRIGDRLQTADGVRSRALELDALLGHLYALSQLPNPKTFADAPGDQYRKSLPPTFWEEGSLADAAALAHKLSGLTSDAQNARQLSKLTGAAGASDQDDGNAAYIKGSLHYASWQVACYCYWLEGRVAEKFMRAMERGSSRAMADACKIMARFRPEQALAQRYVSALPAFSDPKALPLVRPAAGFGAAALAAAAAPFAALCTSLRATLETQIPRMCSIFTDSTKAVDLLVVRVAEERLAPAIAALLLPEGEAEGAAQKPGSAAAGGTEGGAGTKAPSQGQRKARKPRSSDEVSSVRDSDEEQAGAEGDEVSADEEDEDDEGEGAEEGAKRGQVRRKHRASDDDSSAGGEEDEEAEAEGEGEGDDDEGGSESGSSSSLEGDFEHRMAMAYERGSAEHRALRRASQAPIKENPEQLAARLRLLAQVHSGVRGLVAAAEAACGAAGLAGPNLAPLREGLLNPYLATYPTAELRWLDASCRKLLAKLPQPTVDVGVGRQLLGANREAVTRATALAAGSTDGQDTWMQVVAAASVSALFGSGPFDDQPGSLLEQVARYVIDGVEASLETGGILDPAAHAKAEVAAFYAAQEAEAAAVAAAAAAAEAAAASRRRGDPPPPPPAAPKPKAAVTRQVATERAQQFAQKRLQPTLRAVHGASEIMVLLQAHYHQCVEPTVAQSIAELSRCAQGLLVLARAVEEAAASALQRVVDAIIIKAELTFLMTQQRTDFFTPDPTAGPSGAASRADGGSTARAGAPLPAAAPSPPPTRMSGWAGQDKPTPACLLVCAQLAAAHTIAASCLAGANLTALLQEVGARMHALLLNHMQQFTYSAAGALKWKCDITEYVELMAAWGVPGIMEPLHSVQALANVLVVPAESLLPLVDGGLRMDHRDALRYVALRADFRTAVVEGRTLQDLFSSGANTVDQILGQATAGGSG